MNLRRDDGAIGEKTGLFEDAGIFGPEYLVPSRYSIENVEETKSGNERRPRNKPLYFKLVSLCAVVALLFGAAGAVVANFIMERLKPNPTPYPFEDSSMAVAANEASWSSVVKSVAPTIVEVYASEKYASGVIISEDGYIITNSHVITEASQIDIYLYNKTRYTAELVGADPEVDIAILKIEAIGLAAARFGSSDNVRVGDKVIAIGNALGELPLSVTEGIVSYLERDAEPEEGQAMTVMQISVPVSPGNSGGGLFNAYGELVGIVNMKTVGLEVEGIAFAVPADIARSAAIDIIGKDVTGRPSIGVDLKFINSADEAEHYGVSEYGLFIMALDVDGAAEKAGLMLLDRIVSVDGYYVLSPQLFYSIVERHRPGDTVEIEVVRSGKVIVISVMVEFERSEQL